MWINRNGVPPLCDVQSADKKVVVIFYVRQCTLTITCLRAIQSGPESRMAKDVAMQRLAPTRKMLLMGHNLHQDLGAPVRIQAAR